ncbi:MAG: hypothetical protein P1U35_06490 [Cycloclasticus sp.]|jgi:hypothetical protein|nr:hypothetical protein [Cycloclasticus sp.]
MAIKDTFQQRVKQQLDDSLDNLDATTLAKLNNARQHAFDVKTNKNPVTLPWGMGVAGVGALALLVVIVTPINVQNPTPFASLEQLQLFAGTDVEELELFDDLEFYQWLDKTHG